MNLRRLFSLFLLPSLLLIAGPVVEAQAADTKIGFISVQGVLFGSKDGQGAKKELMAKQEQLQAKFGDEAANLESLAEEIEKKESVWSADVLAEKKREAAMLDRDLKLKAEDAQYEVVELRKKVLDPIVKKLDAALKEYGQSEGYTMIIDSDVAARSGMIVYGDPSIDLTETMIKKVDAMQ
ncbi:MAG: OmpH family outer membrane protein [Desulfurivibrionaceae bacterium]|nr:OmpH family outer membrane protein [Desulfurivibrionaceae bacterium]